MPLPAIIGDPRAADYVVSHFEKSWRGVGVISVTNEYLAVFCGFVLFSHGLGAEMGTRQCIYRRALGSPARNARRGSPRAQRRARQSAARRSAAVVSPVVSAVDGRDESPERSKRRPRPLRGPSRTEEARGATSIADFSRARAHARGLGAGAPGAWLLRTSEWRLPTRSEAPHAPSRQAPTRINLTFKRRLPARVDHCARSSSAETSPSSRGCSRRFAAMTSTVPFDPRPAGNNSNGKWPGGRGWESVSESSPIPRCRRRP